MVDRTDQSGDGAPRELVENDSRVESAQKRAKKRSRRTVLCLTVKTRCVRIWNVAWLAVLMLGVLLWQAIYIDSWVSLFDYRFHLVVLAGLTVLVFIWKFLLKKWTEDWEKEGKLFFLESCIISIVLPILTGIGAALGCSFATVELQSSEDPFEVQMGLAGSASEPYEFPGRGKTRRVPFFLPCSSYEVKIESPYSPRKRIQLRPLVKTKIDVDSLFAVRTVLLRPGRDLIEAAIGSPLVLAVTINGGSYEMDYLGQAVWIGVEPDPKIPPWVKDDWKEFPNVTPEMIERWSEPVTISGAPSSLEGCSKITIRMFIRGADGGRGGLFLGPQEIELKTPQGRQDFPQEELIDVLPDDRPDVPS